MTKPTEIRIDVEGTCCACGHTGSEETPCSKNKDATHCVHWWDGHPQEEPPRLTAEHAVTTLTPETPRESAVAIGYVELPTLEPRSTLFVPVFGVDRRGVVERVLIRLGEWWCWIPSIGPLRRYTDRTEQEPGEEYITVHHD